MEIKNKMLKKCPSDKINVTKNALFFHSRAPITVLLSIRYSYMSCSARVISQLYVGFPNFDSALFLLQFVFLFNKKQGLFDFKTS